AALEARADAAGAVDGDEEVDARSGPFTLLRNGPGHRANLLVAWLHDDNDIRPTARLRRPPARRLQGDGRAARRSRGGARDGARRSRVPPDGADQRLRLLPRHALEGRAPARGHER